MSLPRFIALCLVLGIGGYGVASGCRNGSPPNDGSNGGPSAPTGGNGNGAPGRLEEPVEPVVTQLDATCATALSGPFEASMPAPMDVVVEEDDLSARFSWSGPERGYSDRTQNSIEGYRICWGRREDQLAHAALFTSRIGTIYNVPNGVPLVAVVQAVDWRGRVSPPSKVVRFTGSSARVDALAKEMTGFFDDFNRERGPLDELRWNVAFSRCNDPTASHTYVGREHHALSVLGNKTYLPGSEPGCDRDQNIARPRGVFDFRDRIGRITFDFDGSVGDRSTWYVDVLPYESEADIQDITGHVSFDPGHGHPGRFLRFSQAGEHLIIHQLSAEGEPLHVLDTWLPEERALYPGQLLRHWELRVGKSYAAIYIDGELVLENDDINLDFERGIVHFSQFGYNPVKAGYPWHMLHWDNFGFDGPAFPLVVHNYKSSFTRLDSVYVGWPDYKGSWTVEIPDSLDGALGARYFYTIQTHDYSWGSGDSLSIGGRKFSFEEPKSPAGTWQEGLLGNIYPPYSTSMELPIEVLRTGTNTMTFEATSTSLLNQHIEVYFAPGSQPAYTQPREYVPHQLPPLVPFGPSTRWNMINGAPCFREESEWELTFTDSGLVLQRPVSGVMVVESRFDMARPVYMYGRNLGISKVELLVDGKIVASADTAETVAAPGLHGAAERFPHEGGLELSFDTSELDNGAHVLELRAFDSAGTPSRAHYWEYPYWGTDPDDPGFGAPIRFQVAN